jgi:type VI secretion system secreted protein VgrG
MKIKERSASKSAQRSFIAEPLEARLLMSATLPWGGWPKVIDEYQSVSSFPTVNGTGESIAILDTGVDYNDPVFGRSGYGTNRKIRAGYNFVDNNGDFLDTNGHGTAVAAVAAGMGWTVSGHRYEGVAPGAQICALKVDDGSGNISVNEYVAALEWVIGYKAKYNIVAVNISEGGDTDFTSKITGSDYGNLLAELKSMGVFVAVSSGNDSWSDGVEYPAADVSAVAVGSVDLDDSISSFSDTGPDCDLLAPGNLVAAPTLLVGGSPYYVYAVGTSFSSPMAAGAAADLKQLNPSASVDDILETLQDSGVSIYDSQNGDTFKRLDLFSAIATVEDYLRRRR